MEMIVHMDCPGCDNKIRKALQRLDDTGTQKATVTVWADQEKVLKTVRKNGRQAELRPFPHNPEYYNLYQYYYNYDQYQHQSDPTTYFTSNHSISSHNYYEHGNYHQPPYSTILDQQASALFSDENSSACSIM